MLGAEIGVDLGSTNAVIYQKEVGVLYNEPSLVAYDRATGTLLGFGNDALKKASLSIGDVILCGLTRNGAISDYFGIIEILKYVSTKKIRSLARSINSVSFAVRGELSKVQYKAYATALHSSGARSVRFIPVVLLAAFGSGIDHLDPEASLIVHSGSSYTDMAVIACGRIVKSASVSFGGLHSDYEIIEAIRRDKGIEIGAALAEKLKIEAARRSYVNDGCRLVEICGLNVETGLPQRITVDLFEIVDIVNIPICKLVESIKELLVSLGPEVLSDICGKGIVLSGGNALLPQLSEILRQQLELPIYVAEEPLSAVARGFEFVFSDGMDLGDIYIQKIS